VRPAYRRAEPVDPFFNKPYEPSPDADPVWEDKAAGPTTSAGSSLSRFIKPKRKVAALLGGPGSLCR
jgi:ATP-dependent RNA helicase RhlE